MGDLDNWMDENFIKGAFGTAMGDQVSVKIIRDRQSGYVLSSPVSVEWFSVFPVSSFCHNCKTQALSFPRLSCLLHLRMVVGGSFLRY